MDFHCAFDPKADNTWTLMIQRNKLKPTDNAPIEKHYELAGISLDILKNFVAGINTLLNNKKRKNYHFTSQTDNLSIHFQKLRTKIYKLTITTTSDQFEDILTSDELTTLFYTAPFVNYLL